MFGVNKYRVLLIAFGSFLFMGTAQASATAPSEVVDALNNSLFNGNNEFAAGAILTAAVMVAAGIPLAMARMNLIATMIILFSVLGALTAIGWADPTIILVAAMIVVGMFVRQITTYFTGQGGDAKSS